MDGASRLWCLDGDISPQKLAVAKGDSIRSIDTYYIHVLVKLVDLYDDACLVPLIGMWTCLVLNTHIVSDYKVVISLGALSTAQLLSCACS